VTPAGLLAVIVAAAAEQARRDQEAERHEETQ
jgi:hypothetical protein